MKAWKGRQDWIWTRRHFRIWRISAFLDKTDCHLGHEDSGFAIFQPTKTQCACAQVVAGGEMALKSWIVSMLHQNLRLKDLSLVYVVYCRWVVRQGATQCSDLKKETKLSGHCTVGLFGPNREEGAKKMAKFWTFPSHQIFLPFSRKSLDCRFSAIQIFRTSGFPISIFFYILNFETFTCEDF